MALCRLIYRSVATDDIDAELIQQIEEASARNNKHEEVTGVLVANKRSFLQVLEGERSRLSRVFRRIAQDARHEQLDLISFEEVEQRVFDSWAMKGIGVGLMGRIYGQRLRKKYGTRDGDLELPVDRHRAFALLHDVAFYLRGGED